MKRNTKRNIKRMLALTLAGAMVVSSGAGTGQIKAKEADKVVKEKVFKNINDETKYILECKNSLIYNVTHEKYTTESDDESIILQDNNIMTTELTDAEVKSLEKSGITVEEDICVTGSAVKNNTKKQNKQKT